MRAWICWLGWAASLVGGHIGLSSCDRARGPCHRWPLPGPGIRPVSPALAGGFWAAREAPPALFLPPLSASLGCSRVPRGKRAAVLLSLPLTSDSLCPPPGTFCPLLSGIKSLLYWFFLCVFLGLILLTHSCYHTHEFRSNSLLFPFFQ